MRILKRVIKAIAWILGITLCVLILAFALIEVLIGRGVQGVSQKALAQFPGDRVEALMSVADCLNCPLEDRNLAVWALGQLRDKRALPVLYKYRTGSPCNHRTTICQHEISKAIRWTEGKSYMAPQVWRVMLNNDRPRSANIKS